jgi:hypothetical protein
MDDFVVNVRQLSQYAIKPVPQPTDLFLIQEGGLGGAYRSVAYQSFWSGVPGMVLGILPPPAAKGLAASFVTTLLGARQGYNWYVDPGGATRYLQNGLAGIWSFAGDELSFSVTPIGVKDQIIAAVLPIFQLGLSGQMEIAQQLQVGRQPARPNEVVTLDYLKTRGVTSFNKRNGDITLAASDIYFALGLDGTDPLATVGWVNGAICSALNAWYYQTPLVFSFNGRVGTIVLNDADITSACTAPGAMPRTVTPPPGDYSTRIANTTFVADAISDAEAGLTEDLTNYALLDSPVFVGDPQAPTANPGTSTGQLATTAFVMNAVADSVAGVATFNGRSGNVVLNATDIADAGGAKLDSPAFTGTPTSPTPPNTANNGEIATCAWVLDQISSVGAGVVTFNTRSGFVTLQPGDITAAGGALLASPALTGTPTAPTPGVGAAGGQIATVAYVANNAGVTAFNTRTGSVTLNSADISAAGGALIANPTFTGTPAAPTAAPGTATTQLATTAFATAAAAAAVPPAWLGSGFVNKFRNGMMDVNQRTLAAMTAPAYTVDGWIVSPTGTVTPSQVYSQTLGSNALRLTGAVGLTALQIAQHIESFIAAQLLTKNKQTQPVTVQFTIYNGTAAAITPQLATQYPAVQDNFAGTVDNDLPLTNLQTIAAGAVGTVAYTFTPSSPSIANGYNVGLSFGGALNAAGAYVDVSYADIRATPGAAAGLNASPPFPEMRSIAIETLVCSRYYQLLPQVRSIFSILQGGGFWQGIVWLTMRVLPTAVWSVSSVNGLDSWNFAVYSDNSGATIGGATAAQQPAGGAAWLIRLSAEL